MFKCRVMFVYSVDFQCLKAFLFASPKKATDILLLSHSSHLSLPIIRIAKKLDNHEDSVHFTPPFLILFNKNSRGQQQKQLI